MLAFDRWLGGAHSEQLIQKLFASALMDCGSINCSKGKLSNMEGRFGVWSIMA